MDFFEHQERARHKTGLLIAYFAVAVAMIIVSVYMAVALFLFYGGDTLFHLDDMRPHPASSTLWFPDVFAAVSAGTLIVISLGSMFKITELARGGEVVARSLGGRPLDANTRDLRERVLLNVVEEMAIASGTPVPPVFLLDQETAINAFAAGTTPQNAVIGVTRGAIETLNRDELQGVIAHEFSHILNGDMRLNIRLIGILNGILVLAMIGYFLMRTVSSSSDSRRGANPLPFLGLCLYIVGYVGIFFGHLIKSAVSRQREFLADASAVQFTRLPQGIEGALKKIGGLIRGSRLETPKAEDASHMFFGNGLRTPWLQLLSTHPPLVQRIRRIDPTFDGHFPPAHPITYSPQDLVDPHALAARRAAPQLAQDAALAAAGGAFAFSPAAAVAQVGAPQPKHLDYAAALVGALPAELSRNLRDPLGAVATIYALLLDPDAGAVRQAQLDYLATKADPRANQETLRIAPVAATVGAAAKLPLISMVLPALERLSPNQLTAFRDDVEFLIAADHKLDLFEYAVRRLVLKRLLPRLERRQPRAAKYAAIQPLMPACVGLLSTLAYAGTPDEQQAHSAFQQGVNMLVDPSQPTPTILPKSQCGLNAVDTALSLLVDAIPGVKKRAIAACAAVIGADNTVTIEEGELLRIIADALDCPMPLLVPGQSG
jgi:Zn-dependent protease with chaperone function